MDEGSKKDAPAAHEDKDAELTLLRTFIGTFAAFLALITAGRDGAAAVMELRLRDLLREYADTYSAPRLRARGVDTSLEATTKYAEEVGIMPKRELSPAKREAELLGGARRGKRPSELN